MERSKQEIAEIERHKYYLSQERGYDVGWEFAEHDWEQNFGPAFRGESAKDKTAVATESCCAAPSNGGPAKVASSKVGSATVGSATVGSATAATSSVATCGDSVATNVRVDDHSSATSNSSSRSKCSSTAAPVGRIRRLFDRIFSSSK
jgi:hypothetical protein